MLLMASVEVNAWIGREGKLLCWKHFNLWFAGELKAQVSLIFFKGGLLIHHHTYCEGVSTPKWKVFGELNLASRLSHFAHTSWQFSTWKHQSTRFRVKLNQFRLHNFHSHLNYSQSFVSQKIFSISICLHSTWQFDFLDDLSLSFPLLFDSLLILRFCLTRPNVLHEIDCQQWSVTCVR